MRFLGQSSVPEGLFAIYNHKDGYRVEVPVIAVISFQDDRGRFRQEYVLADSISPVPRSSFDKIYEDTLDFEAVYFKRA